MSAPNGNLKAEVIQAVRENPDLTYAQIAELLGVKPHQVAVWANADGIYRRRKPGCLPNPEKDGLDNKIQQLEQQLAEARRLKAATEIRFEREGSKVAIYGIVAQPLIAEYKDWLRFLRGNWAARLRGFIQAQFGGTNGNGTLQ
jgi:hypothetical protein